MDNKNRVISWIEESMKEEGFSEMVIELMGTNEKGEGYVADFIFAKVTGTDKDNKSKKVHLAIKMGKSSKTLRESVPTMKDVCEREIFVYSKVLPTFWKFQCEKNILNIFNSYPKCYKTFLYKDMEALVFENLRKRGFALHPTRKPMNLQHIRLVLKNYAKLHALSFALRDQNKSEFDELTADYSSLWKEVVLSAGVFRKKEKILEHLKKGGREDLLGKYEKYLKKGKEKIILDILDDAVQESVITHGDCHNNNFLFEYKDIGKENPLGVAIIDWQISILHSPVLDLSYFLYFCASGELLSRLKELLEFYHSHLSDFLGELGSDAERLFPYRKLVNHWKKYSPYGFICVTSFLEMFFVAKEDAPAFEDVKERDDMVKFMEDIKLIDEDSYRERLISVIDNHLNFELE